MSIVTRLRRPAADQPAEEATTTMPGELPIPRYDRLDAKEVASQLSKLSQVELATVEAYERGNQNRHVVLEKLHYLLTVEPLPGYDTLESDQVIEALAGANGQTLRSVRDYERKFQRRPAVATAIAEMLPTSQLSAGEVSAQAEKDERVRSRPEPGTAP
jgi:hypothetical protein